MAVQKILESYNATLPVRWSSPAGKAGWREKRYCLRVGADNREYFKLHKVWPDSNYSVVRREQSCGWPARSATVWNGIKYVTYDIQTVPVDPPAITWPLDQLEAISYMKFHKMFADLKIFDVGVFLAELPEAVSHVTKTATVLVESMLLLRKGKVGKAMAKLEIKKSKRVWVDVYLPSQNKSVRKKITARQHRKMIADQIYDKRARIDAAIQRKLITKSEAQNDYFNFVSARWLELHYGWYPLISDTDALVKMAVLGVDFVAPPVKLRISTARNGKQVIEKPVTSTTTYNVISARLSYEADIVLAKPLVIAPYTFGVNSIFPAIWEAVPLSFVVDWFVPVGKYIESLTMPEGIRITNVVRTYKRSTDYNTVGTTYAPAHQPWNKMFLGSETRGWEATFQRKINTKPPSLTVPGVIALSGVEGWLSNVDNMLSAIALLKTIFLNPK